MPLSSYTAIFTQRRVAFMLLLGFSSGLPLALTTGTLQAWATVDGLDIKTISSSMKATRRWVKMTV